jgi:hypothetical protein
MTVGKPYALQKVGKDELITRDKKITYSGTLNPKGEMLYNIHH